MEKIKMKLQEWKQECKRVCAQVREKAKKLKSRLKRWAIKTLIRVEDKMGKDRRCQFCYENFACEEYFPIGKSFWREFFHPHRCTPKHSDR